MKIKQSEIESMQMLRNQVKQEIREELRKEMGLDGVSDKEEKSVKGKEIKKSGRSVNSSKFL